MPRSESVWVSRQKRWLCSSPDLRSKIGDADRITFYRIMSRKEDSMRMIVIRGSMIVASEIDYIVVILAKQQCKLVVGGDGGKSGQSQIVTSWHQSITSQKRH